MTDNNAQLRYLLDRQAIADVLATYSRAIDRLDRDLLISVYHPDAIDDHGVFVGSREEFADWAIKMHTSTHFSHQHCIMNHTCDLQGDIAHVESYYMFVGMNKTGIPLAMSGGRYIDRMENRHGKWAIAARVCVRDWAPLETIPDSLDQSLMTVVKIENEGLRAVMRAGPRPERNSEDISYRRPLSIPLDRVAAYQASIDD